jgi:hypothetical protein
MNQMSGMTTTGIFTTARHDIPIAGSGVPHKLVIWGDVHRDAPLCAVDRWAEFLDYCRTLKNATYLGMGDYMDMLSTSERVTLAGELHESTRDSLDDLAEKRCQEFAAELKPMKGKLIGLIEGNHYWQFQSGVTSTQRLCQLMGCKYLGVAAFIRLSLARQTKGKSWCKFDVFAHHGKGAARLVGGSFNRVQQLDEVAVADAYIMGHDHKRGVLPATPRLVLEESHGKLSVRERTGWIIRSGSFLKAYQDGKRSYNVDAGRAGCSLGWTELELTLKITEGNTRVSVRGIA